jgi:hypothetical protein
MSGDLPTIRPQPSEEGQPGLHQHLSGFEVSGEVEAVAQHLIDSHSRLQFLEDWAVGYALEHTDPPDEQTPHVIGRAKLVPKAMRAFSRVDAVVHVNAPIWQILTEPQREALVLHELLHFGTNEKSGALEILPHDVEEFGYVAATYGAWSPNLRNFAGQLQLGLEHGPSDDR